MLYRQLGSSDVKVSAITLGTWAIGGWMWGGQDEADAVAAINRSIELGITSIDTAAAYGLGQCEALIGKTVRSKRDKVQILTKYGLRWDRTDGEFHFESQDLQGKPIKIYKNSRRGSVMEECEMSLRRLGTDYIDLYQCHWRDHSTPLEETMEVMDKLLKQGKIRAAGVSNFAVDDLHAAHNIVPLASNQPPYSMINRGIEQDVLPCCRTNNIAVIVYSPMQRGLLTGRIDENTVFPPGDHRAADPFFKPQNRRKVSSLLQKLRPIAEQHNATLAQLVVNWTIHRPGITAALVGARNSRQADENAHAADFTLSETETAEINSLLDEVKLDL